MSGAHTAILATLLAAPASGDAPPPAPAGAAAPTAPEVLTVSEGESTAGPPFYTEEDAEAFRRRHGLEPRPPEVGEPSRWRCLIADPSCGTTFELTAMGAYAHRFRQASLRDQSSERWSSGRAQYDFWVHVPTVVETRGLARHTRLTMGPKGGVIYSDTGSLWGNLGIGMRYWFGVGRFSPTIEFSTALAYKIGARPAYGSKFEMTRGPVGFTMDVGIGIGGYGALVLGGQYDSALVREDVPENYRVAAGGMVFVGFRGNILWGAPAGVAIATHGLTERYVGR